MAFQTAWVEPTFNALIAAATFPMAFNIIIVALALVPVLDCRIAIHAVHLAISGCPANPIFFALAATVGDGIFRLACSTILHDFLIAIFINDFSVVE
jgi:hypothetical protein